MRTGRRNGKDPGGGGFPGGGPGGNGEPGGNGGSQMPNPGTSSSDYSIQIMGGNIWVDAEGDGLDSNGDLTITGGNLVVFGAASNGSSADNSALDYDGTGTISGATVSSADQPETGESETDAKEPETGESETDKKDPETGESETKAPESQSSTKETNGVQETQQSSQKAEQVKPKKTKITAIQKKNGKITIKWKKVSGASGYEVWYSAKKKSGYKKLTVKKVQKVTVKTGKKLKKGKTWYLKVRSYKVTGGTKVYSKWSEVKKVKS